MRIFTRIAIVLSGLTFLIPGLWAFFWPRSFYENIATFEPFNLHFLHDVGAFQIGMGAAMLSALVWSDALLVVLFGGSIGTVVHVVSHVMDRDLGGRASDPLTLGVLALALVVALVARTKAVASANRAERPGKE